MKKSILMVLTIFLISEMYGQCDPANIFSNETTNAVCFEINDNVRKCYSNNIPDHEYGPFGGGNTIEAQDFEYSMCLYPELGTSMTELIEDPTSPGCGNGIVFGITIQGVNYSPFARIYWVNPNTMEENLDYIVEADFILNMDLNGGHVNAVNRYHYHNISTDYFANDLNIDGTTHSPLLGYAADGFPIYYRYLYTDPLDSDSGVTGFESSFALKSGSRPGDGITAPDGPYDGNYVQDYEYIASLSELDECGGRFGVTPDYPNGTYYYVLTDNWPWIPRCLKGKYVDNSFRLGQNCPASTAMDDCSVLPTQVESIGQNLNVYVYPNPANEYVWIELAENISQEKITGIKIYNLDASLFYRTDHFVEKIDVSALACGPYFIQIDSERGQVTKQIIIQ